ncbi:hypothetical protein EZV62_009643 [Acer yangbiense]|uniref:Uncharacterized protein n=1 Tax=Acer yangbiense TaxID=1000413 RepID=A0A5C7I0V3_9ROSI|nr:hypothetical protein EZV62_009643 [Acer yangbiense]
MHQHHRNRQNREELRSETLKENYLGMLYCRWQGQLGFLDSIFTTTTLELPLRMSRLKLRTSMASMFLRAKGNLIALPDSTLYVALKITNIFETLGSENTAEAPLASAKTEEVTAPLTELQFLKWHTWLLGPSLLLSTGMVPTLWLPISSIFLGPNIARLLSLIGLDCIFNLGATLFLLMADSCARPKNRHRAATASLLLVLTELLTWHWQSPVWLVTPVVYESYRVLQLMRGLKLGAELSAPAWMMLTIRLVCWWVLILGMQLMRVAWFAGFTTGAHKQHYSSASADG